MNTIKEVYLCKIKNEKIWEESSSGGVFFPLAKEIIEKYNGVVYGACYTEDFRVEHRRATSVSELKMFMGSKYVQSQCTDAYKEVLEDLTNDHYVMFVGTACQIDALLGLLKNKNNKLITIDVLCHGTPSPKIFKDYIKFQETQHKDKIKTISFRGKQLKHEVQDMFIEFKSSKRYRSFSTNDVYYNFFLQNLSLRPSCFNCPYACAQRISDITLADYWGDPEILPSVMKKTGASSVFINTEEGRRLFDEIKDVFFISESDLTVCEQPNLIHPTIKPTNYDDFWKYYINNGFSETIKRFAGDYKKITIMRQLKVFLNETGLLTVIRRIKGRIK